VTVSAQDLEDFNTWRVLKVECEQGARKISEGVRVEFSSGGIVPLFLWEQTQRSSTGEKVVKRRTLQEEENRRLEVVE
jgi:hypothetical protein